MIVMKERNGNGTTVVAEIVAEVVESPVNQWLPFGMLRYLQPVSFYHSY